MVPEPELREPNGASIRIVFVVVGAMAVVVGFAWFVATAFLSAESKFTDPIADGHRGALEDLGFAIEESRYGADYRDGPVDIATLELDVRGTGCDPQDVSCVRDVLAAQSWVASVGAAEAGVGFSFELFEESVGNRCQGSAELGVGLPPEGENWTFRLLC